MKKVYLASVFIFMTIATYAQTLTSEATGDWSASDSWKESRTPQGGDEITILADHTIIISGNEKVTGDPVVLHVYGTLYFGQTGQLELPAGSEIYVYEGGDVEVADPDNNSTKLIIGNNSNKLSGADLDAVEGPAYLDEDNLQGGGETLPVTLLYFTATAKSSTVEIKWASSKAWDFSHYELERSANGRDFSKIADIAASKNSEITETYAYTDHQPLSGTSYYRLKAVDIDGSFEYKGIELVKFGAKSFKVYPNPSTQGYIQVAWSHAAEGTIILLKDNSGRTVRTARMRGNTQLSTDGLSAGLYVLSLEGPAGIKQSQVMIR